MPEFDEKVRAAFDAELKRAPARPGLRQRVIANAVATPRTRQQGLGAWLTPPKLAVVGAAAAVLIVAGIGIRTATQGAPTAHKSPAPSTAPLAFGPVPAPALHPPQGLGAGGGPAIAPYFGPANMTWSGQLPKVPNSAPLFRFSLPSTAQADAFAARLGGTLTSAGSATEPRRYQLQGGLVMSINFYNAVAGEPTFNIYSQSPPSGTRPLGEAAARAAADAELVRLGLTPSWKSSVTVTTVPSLINQGPIYFVNYQRLIEVSPGVTAGEVDGNGDPAGLEVVVDSSGKANEIIGSLRLAEGERAFYPLRAPASTVNDALKSPPIYPNKGGPVPTVALTKIRLVYTVVSSGGVGYVEPAYLYTGTFGESGALNEKRVLVPAVAPSALSH